MLYLLLAFALLLGISVVLLFVLLQRMKQDRIEIELLRRIIKERGKNRDPDM